MTVRQQWGIVGAIVLVIGIALVAASHFMQDDLFPVTVGSKAPDFHARKLGSRSYETLASYKGKVVLLNVWATYCEPCKVEMPSLEKLHQAYGDSGLKIVAVEIDPTVSDDSVAKYAKTYGLTFEIVRDTTHALEKQYQVTGYPESFVIGPEGTIRKKWISADDWASQGNRALVAQLLGLQTPKPVVVTGSD